MKKLVWKHWIRRYAVNNSLISNAGLMVGQRRRRWPNIKPALESVIIHFSYIELYLRTHIFHQFQPLYLFLTKSSWNASTAFKGSVMWTLMFPLSYYFVTDIICCRQSYKLSLHNRNLPELSNDRHKVHNAKIHVHHHILVFWYRKNILVIRYMYILLTLSLFKTDP